MCVQLFVELSIRLRLSMVSLESCSEWVCGTRWYVAGRGTTPGREWCDRRRSSLNIRPIVHRSADVHVLLVAFRFHSGIGGSGLTQKIDCICVFERRVSHANPHIQLLFTRWIRHFYANIGDFIVHLNSTTRQINKRQTWNRVQLTNLKVTVLSRGIGNFSSTSPTPHH